MKRNPFISFIALFILILSSCEKDNINEIDTISYGISTNSCVDYCFKILIGTNKITFLKKKDIDNPKPTICTEPIAVDEVNALKALVSTSDFTKLPNVIDCPDCADGGAEWVSLRLDGELKTVKFEYGEAPKELKELVLKLRAIEERFKDCN